MEDNKVIYQVDAFTNEPFKGNPAGVMLVDTKVTSEWMQNMALEMNLSETTFIIPDRASYKIRYFTPSKEIPLCGHATLAGSHIIYELGLKSKDEAIVFNAEGGELVVRKEGDWLVMNFPTYPLRKVEVNKAFKVALGFQPTEMYTSLYDWVVAVAETESDIKNATPDFESMKRNGLGHLVITAKSNALAIDYVLRCFAPSFGINEDPVTGSAQCALAPLWSSKLGKAELEALQLSKRTGLLKVKLDNDRVDIKGQALTVLEAKVNV